MYPTMMMESIFDQPPTTIEDFVERLCERALSDLQNNDKAMAVWRFKQSFSLMKESFGLYAQETIDFQNRYQILVEASDGFVVDDERVFRGVERFSIPTRGTLGTNLASNKRNQDLKSIQDMVVLGVDTWAPKLPIKRAVVNFSSPDTAKEMDVGHLRCIIGETLARMLEYSKVEVVRRYHIAADDTETEYDKHVEYLDEKFPVYQRLGVHLEEKEESFYKPYIAYIIEEFKSKGLVFVKESDTRVISIEGFKLPLTLLAALWYHLKKEKADWIIYVTDVGQQQQFDMLFKAARKAGWLPANQKAFPRVDHIGFGLVAEKDGKQLVRMVDLLDEAERHSKTEKLDVGVGALKYAILKNNMSTDETLSFAQLFDEKGDTIFSILNNAGTEKAHTSGINLDNAEGLTLHLLRFEQTFSEACMTLKPHVLCDYVKSLAKLQSECNGSHNEVLFEATAIVMQKCFHVLGF